MKKLFLTIAILLAAFTLQAGQVVKKTAAIKVERVAKPEGSKQDKSTDWCYQDRDGFHQIYQGASGGMYYWKVAKSGKNAGKPVKRYLSKEDKQKVNANKK